VPTTTTSTTTTSTTGVPIQAEIAMSFQNDGSGNISIFANVISGSNQNTLNFFGNVDGFQSSGCIGVADFGSFSFNLNVDSTSASSLVYNSIDAIISEQITSFFVNGIEVTTNPQIVTVVGGQNYLITGFSNCFETPPPTTTTTTSTTTAVPTTTTTTTSTTVQPIQARVFMAFSTSGGFVTAINAIVAEGVTLDDLDFSGTTTVYDAAICGGTPTPNLFSFTLLAGSNDNSDTFGTTGISGKVTALDVSTNTITINPQNIVVGGNIYEINGFDQCASA